MADTDVARQLYAGLGTGDPHAILAVLSDDFRGEVSAGMPAGVGGVHDGPEAMLRDAWGAVDGTFDVRPEPAEFLTTDDGRVVVIGRYRGRELATGHEIDAVFAHVLRVRDGRIHELRQITDTASWTA